MPTKPETVPSSSVSKEVTKTKTEEVKPTFQKTLPDGDLDPIKDVKQEEKLVSFQYLVEEKSGYRFNMFKPVASKSKLEAGLKYTIKYQVSDTHCIIAKIFEPSFHTGIRTTCEHVEVGIPLDGKS